MYTAIFSLAKAWWKEIAVVLVLLGVYLYYHHLTSTIEDQAKQLVNLQTANAVLTESNNTLKKTIEDSNETIRKIGAGAEETKQAFSDLNTSVSDSLAALNPKLEAIRKGMKPQTCPDTLKYLLDARKEYAK